MAAGTAVRGSFLTDLAIIVDINNTKFSHADFIEFALINRLNEPPSGYFRVIDLNSKFMKSMSATYGRLTFTNTSDGSAQKMSSIDFFVTDMKKEQVDSGNSMYFISWKAGTRNQNKKITHAYKGNSAKVMADIFSKAGDINIIRFPSAPITEPVDDMNWITPQSNMWEQLDSVVSKSFRQNDYMFWAWDDVNNAFKISSFQIEKQRPDKYIIMESEQAIGSTKEVKGVTNDDSFTIWRYDNAQVMNILGLEYKKIFPNVAFTGIVGGTVTSASFKKKSFVEFLRSNIKDDKIEEIIALEGGDEVSYGDLVVKRHWPNNTHQLYSFADTYREYKLATHAKQAQLQIYNNMGPSIGSKVIFLKSDDAYRSGTRKYDELFSDKYILTEKVLLYNTKSANISSAEMTQTSANFIMNLKLVSDNFTTDTKKAEENTKLIRSKIK